MFSLFSLFIDEPEVFIPEYSQIVKALVHHVGTATVGVRVPAGATKKGHWVDPCTEGVPIVQRNTTTLEDLDVY